MMKSSLRIPYDWAGFDVETLQLAVKSLHQKERLVSILSKWELDDVKALPATVVLSAYQRAVECMNRRPSNLHKSFILDGTRYFFIEDWPNLTTAEYVDIETFSSEPIANAHSLLAIFYREKKDGKLVPYDGPLNEKKFLKVSAEVIGGAFLFFYLSAESYKANFRRFLLKKEGAEMYLHTMAGTIHSTSAQEKMQQK